MLSSGCEMFVKPPSSSGGIDVGQRLAGKCLLKSFFLCRFGVDVDQRIARGFLEKLLLLWLV
jgi:hypothetical protein